MADRVEQLDSRTLGGAASSARLDRVRPAGTRAPRGRSTRRRGCGSARALEEAAARTLAARLRRHAPRDRRPPGPRDADPGDPRAPGRPRRAARPPTSTSSAAGRATRSSAWLGDLPVHLCAEHGYFVRAPGGRGRHARPTSTSRGCRASSGSSTRVAADVPGTLVERKAASVAWHYRQAEPDYGTWRARELLVALENVLGGVPAEVLPGRRVIEVRARGVNKGAYVERLLAARVRRAGQLVLAAGDDVTDADLFRALPAGAIAIHVGRRAAARGRRRLEHEYVVDLAAALRRRPARARDRPARHARARAKRAPPPQATTRAGAGRPIVIVRPPSSTVANCSLPSSRDRNKTSRTPTRRRSPTPSARTTTCQRPLPSISCAESFGRATTSRMTFAAPAGSA